MKLLMALWLSAALIPLILYAWRRERAVRRIEAENSTLRDTIQVWQECYRQTEETLRDVRRISHDLRHLLSITPVDRLEQQENLLRLKDVLDADSLRSSGSLAIAMLIDHYRKRIESLGVQPDLKLDIGEGWERLTPDLCLVLSNLLENAFEALQREGGGWVRGRSCVTEGWISIVVANSSASDIRVSKGGYLSSKKEGRFGIGLDTVRRIAEQYGGKAEFSSGGGVFKASVFLSKNSEPELDARNISHIGYK